MSDFWTRRRAAARAETVEEERAQQARERSAAEAGKTDEELLAELDLPHPDTLDLEADFAAFMREAVPQRLKSMALRRLWRLKPVLANLDGLVDYGEDYTDAATCVPNLATDYQVGKGLRAHVEHLEEIARRALAAEGDAEEVEESPRVAEAVDIDASRSADEVEALDQSGAPDETAPEADLQSDPTRHRMTFRFEDSATT